MALASTFQTVRENYLEKTPKSRQREHANSTYNDSHNLSSLCFNCSLIKAEKSIHPFSRVALWTPGWTSEGGANIMKIKKKEEKQKQWTSDKMLRTVDIALTCSTSSAEVEEDEEEKRGWIMETFSSISTSRSRKEGGWKGGWSAEWLIENWSLDRDVWSY